MDTLQNLLSRLDKVRSSGGNRYLACCPAHEDRSPSLAISSADDRLLIHCFAGCSPDEILGAIDLDMSALFDEPLKHTKPLTSEQEQRMAKQQGHKIFRATAFLEIVTSGLRNKEHVTDAEINKARAAKRYLQSVGVLAADERVEK